MNCKAINTILGKYNIHASLLFAYQVIWMIENVVSMVRFIMKLFRMLNVLFCRTSPTMLDLFCKKQ
jgi:hypothetical protein